MCLPIKLAESHRSAAGSFERLYNEAITYALTMNPNNRPDDKRKRTKEKRLIARTVTTTCSPKALRP